MLEQTLQNAHEPGVFEHPALRLSKAIGFLPQPMAPTLTLQAQAPAPTRVAQAPAPHLLYRLDQSPHIVVRTPLIAVNGERKDDYRSKLSPIARHSTDWGDGCVIRPEKD